MSPDLVLLGLDAVVFGLMYQWYKKSSKTADIVKGTKKVEIDNTLAQAVIDGAENGDFDYVLIEGLADVAKGSVPLRSRNYDLGVIQTLKLTEHRAKRVDSYWSDTTKVIRDRVDTIPFNIMSTVDSTSNIRVSEPTSSYFLMDELTTTYDSFEPSKAGVWEKGLDRIFGDVSKGFQETEQMLRVGTGLIGIGKLTIQNNTVKIIPPEIPGAKYILSTLSKSEIISSLESKSKVLKVVTCIFGAAGIALLAFCVYRRYKNWLEQRQAAEVFDEIRHLQQEQVRGGGDNGANGDNDLTCVICLSNRREVVLLECGHICVCVDCAEALPAPRTCPICRQAVSRMVSTYVP